MCIQYFFKYLCLNSTVQNIFSCLCICKVVSIGQDIVLVVVDMDHVVYELELRKSQNEDCNGVIHRLQIKATSKSRLSIPLCRF